MKKIDFSVNPPLDESQAPTRLISHISHPEAWKVRDYFTFNTDHKVIGIQYLVTGFIFYLISGLMAIALRTKLATADADFLDPTPDNALMTNHGTIIIFLWIVKSAIGGFGNYLVPLMIGARNMAFPKLNAIAFWLNLVAGLLLLLSFIFSNYHSNWTTYPPLSLITANNAQSLWILSIILGVISSILDSINFVITILMMKVPSMKWDQIPLFCWAILGTSILAILSTPILAVGLFLLLFDINFGTSFFKPDADGNVVIYQHLSWFYAHPAVYLMILPIFGILSEIIPTHVQKPIFSYKAIAFSTLAICVVGLFVWVQHLFTNDTPNWMQILFTLSPLIVAVALCVKICVWVATLWGRKIRFTSAMLFAIGFLFMFAMGSLSGIIMGTVPFEVHDTYYVVGHFHYVLFGGSVLGIYAGIYHWFPKMTGRMMNEAWGRVHFVLTFIGTNLTFLPMHKLGLQGMSRRMIMYDPQFITLNQLCTIGAFLLGLSVIPFALNAIFSWQKGELAGDNPWESLTLEWTTSSPPIIENWEVLPVVTHGPYDYEYNHDELLS
ncbi:MAG: cbb3-type cytochrome c oxidase subunit I [Dolichospermum sp. DET50]|nr:cbb3-type cytochrome c oxidase subunit I [Dolichospermum sp. DET66]MBS3032628.1 cbb3-type cytochrome c oxidase subunit I [Dolichospermum sp. DET67]MBS3037834.1 cbb3-type cytochrome c oxidase subunit I [Dolichospermum sp. DET50]QSX69767.1 MAG: cbb3-type cytochrome c oxidase subunit I [Dolichospermum sp. DET69]